METTVNCPECDDEIIVTVNFNANYGADADGNRGVSRDEVELAEHGCDLTEEQIEELEDEAIQNLGDEDD